MALTQVAGGLIASGQTITSPTLSSPTINGTPVMGASVITSGTAVASTSGTSIDFTSIPSWVKRITVMVNGVSTNGSSITQVQLGTSGGIQTSGYSGSVGYIQNANASGASLLSAGFLFSSLAGATVVFSGSITLSLLNAASGIWVCSGVISRSDAAVPSMLGGVKTLSGTLDRVRITTVNGSDTFDAGSINILYE